MSTPLAGFIDMLDLEAIELIKQLKARYFRFLDTRNIEGLQSVFASDAQAYFKGGSYEFSLNGWPELEAFYQDNFSPHQFGIHNGHHPEITVEGDQATGLWYLQDMFIDTQRNITTRGSAIYEDSYKKIDGEWKISRTGYKRLLEEIEERDDRVTITASPIA